jgi:quercetin dioxygenase-like cupin family protein
MEAKFQDATLNRPKGDRIIDAPFVFADLEKFVSQLKSEESWEKNDRNGITIYKTEGLTIVLTCLHKEAEIKDNTVEGLLTVQVIEGSIDFIVATGAMTLEKNQLITLHPDIQHTIKAKEETVLLLTTKM